MLNILICIVLFLLVVWIATKLMKSSSVEPLATSNSYGYATEPEIKPKQIAPSRNVNDYNDYLQSVALEPTIKEQHNEWLDNLQINLQPRMYSIRDDCDDGETPRWGLLKKDYSNVIDENQNISIPSGRTCTDGNGGNSRWGGYTVCGDCN